jgi:methionyl aminopeptidase
VDGYIGDTACTVEVGTSAHRPLIEAAEQALAAGLDAVSADARVADVSAAIEDAVHARGFEPIRNLQGHSLERYTLHAGLSIPNHRYKGTEVLREGDTIAIEPFVTTGKGFVVDAGMSNIYRVARHSLLTKRIDATFRGLPFSEAWLHGIYGDETYRRLSILMKRRLVVPYGKLVEVAGGIVAQAERTVRVIADGCEILTTSDNN